MAAPLINLDFNQINTLQDFQSAGQYADAYRYMRDIVRDQQPYASTLERAMEYQRLENWLDRAASINANDGSYSSEFVRGATEAIAEKIGKPINDARFQDASDKLAKSVIKDVIDNQGILSPTDIINKDVNTAVHELDLPPWGWAGTIGDILPPPIGLGKDYQNLPTSGSWRDIGDAWGSAFAAN